LRTIICILLPVLEMPIGHRIEIRFYAPQRRTLCAYSCAKTIRRPAFVRALSFLAQISLFSYFSQNIFPIIHDSITKSSLERFGRICYNNHTMATCTIRLPALPIDHFDSILIGKAHFPHFAWFLPPHLKRIVQDRLESNKIRREVILWIL
jgi:hypothetical protein